MRDRPEPRCEGQEALFTSTDKRLHALAAATCHGTNGRLRCPLFDDCAATAADILAGPHRAGLHGTWAGKLYKQRTKA